MRQRPRKPTGKTGVLEVGVAKQEFVPLLYGNTKEEIEEFFLQAAMRSGLSRELDIIGEPRRNEESDFDYAITTPQAVEYIDLTEFAPLEKTGGSYENVPETTDAGPFARIVCQKILDKAKKYGRKPHPRLHLLVYTTDFRLHLFREIEELVAFWLHCSPPVFTTIFYVEPHDQNQARLCKLYPRPKEEFHHFDAEKKAFTRRIAIDLSSAPTDAIPDKDGWISGPTLGRWSAKEMRFIKDTKPMTPKTTPTPTDRRRERNRRKRERKKRHR